MDKTAKNQMDGKKYFIQLTKTTSKISTTTKKKLILHHDNFRHSHYMSSINLILIIAHVY